ncbi:hypothetical protein JOM56_000045 [Amanita muscaria]
MSLQKPHQRSDLVFRGSVNSPGIINAVKRRHEEYDVFPVVDSPSSTDSVVYCTITTKSEKSKEKHFDTSSARLGNEAVVRDDGGDAFLSLGWSRTRRKGSFTRSYVHLSIERFLREESGVITMRPYWKVAFRVEWNALRLNARRGMNMSKAGKHLL